MRHPKEYSICQASLKCSEVLVDHMQSVMYSADVKFTFYCVARHSL